MSTPIRRIRRPPIRRGAGRPAGGQLVADREQLLGAAERLIRTDGPDVTMEAIAAASTVTKPILYRTIGDREAVTAALAERFVERLNTAGTAAVEKATGPRDGLRRMVEAYVDIVQDERNLFLFVTAGSSVADPGQALRLADRSAVPIAAQLANHRRNHGLDPSVASTWAYGMIGAMQYVTLWWLRDQPWGPKKLVDQLTQLLWSGLAGEPPGTQSTTKRRPTTMPTTPTAMPTAMPTTSTQTALSRVKTTRRKVPS